MYARLIAKGLRILEHWGLSHLAHALGLVVYHRQFKALAVQGQTSTPSHKPRLLLISHELSNTGAPRALYLLACALRGEYDLTLISPLDGPMRILFQAESIPCIVYAPLFQALRPEILTEFARHFDGVVANTMIAAPAVQQLQAEQRVMWWIHEAKLLQVYLEKHPQVRGTLRNCRHLYSVTPYAREFLLPYNRDAKILQLGLIDVSAHYPACHPQDKVSLMMIGNIVDYKAQDVLIAAVQKLSPVERAQVEFHLIGKLMTPEILEPLKNLPCIHYHGELPHAETLAMLSQQDLLLCISRDDSAGIVVVEAWMLSVPCLVSDGVGHAPFVHQGKNGFLVKAGSVDELVAQLTAIIQNPTQLAVMKTQARQTFLTHFDFEKFQERCLAEVRSLLAA